MRLLAIWSFLAVGVIWFGYPALMAVLASLVGPRRGTQGAALDSATTTVSVVVATVDGDEQIRERLADLRGSAFPRERLELVVALDANRAARADSFPVEDALVRVVDGHAPGGKAATLNAGVAASSGEVLVFTDVAQRFAPDAVARLVSALEDPRVAAVSGALHIGRDGRAATLAERYWRFERWLRGVEARVHSPVGVTGAVWAMRRSAWSPLPAGLILDDLYTPMRLVLAGHRVGFEPRALAYDDRRFPAAQEFRRKVRTLTGVLQLVSWLPDVLLPWRNPVWLQFYFHKLLRLCTPYLLLLGAASTLAWGLRLLGAWGMRTVLVSGLVALAGTGAIIAAVAPLRRAVVMAVAMQAAVVRATVNGLRGRWDVWSR